MPRARNIKPAFFKNEYLADLPADVRLLFIGLWTLADREGRMEDRPKRIKGELFPFDMADVDSMLNQLQSNGFVVRYEVSGARYLQVVNFVKHQDPHYKEKASEIPPPPGATNLIEATGITRETRARIMERDGYKCRACGADDYLSIDHVVPASRGGSGEDSNLQVLCMKCNGGKGNKLPGEGKGTRRSKHDDTSLRTRAELESMSVQASRVSPGLAPLIPDSGYLNPSSLNPPPTGGEARKRAATSPPPERPQDVAEQVWNDWLALRKEKRAKVTPTVLEGAISEAGKAHMTLEAFLRVWCSLGWQGLTADRLPADRRVNGAARPLNRQLAVEAENSRVLDEWLGQSQEHPQ